MIVVVPVNTYMSCTCNCYLVGLKCIFPSSFCCLEILIFVVAVVYQWRDLHTEPQSTMINCGFLLDMMEMPGLVNLLFHFSLKTKLSFFSDQILN